MLPAPIATVKPSNPYTGWRAQRVARLMHSDRRGIPNMIAYGCFDGLIFRRDVSRAPAADSLALLLSRTINYNHLNSPDSLVV